MILVLILKRGKLRLHILGEVVEDCDEYDSIADVNDSPSSGSSMVITNASFP